MKNIILSISAVLSLLIVLPSCNLNDSTTTQPQSGAFLVAQTSPDAPVLTVYINNSAFDTLPFGKNTPYIATNPGTYNFAVGPYGSSTSTFSNNVTLEANKFYSYFIIDSFNKAKSALVPDVFQQPAGDSVYIRFFNFCPNATEPLDLVTDNNVQWSQGRTFNDQSNPQFVAFTEKAAGTYTLNLTTSISDSVLKTQSITLTGGRVYTLYAKGLEGSTDSAKALSIELLENFPQK